MLCPLCQSHDLKPLQHRDVPGDLFHCQICDLIFKEAQTYLPWSEQKTRYDQHRNDIENPGYVQFFEQLLGPLRQHLRPNISALDWGSGPGEAPVLAQLLAREALKVDLFDPIYQPNLSSSSVYDLITSTEVLEHFQTPRASLREILFHLKPQGVFAGLTQFHQGPEKFGTWWYVKDPTHVVFYSEKTFQWIADFFSLEILTLQNPVFIFRKK